MKLNQLKLLVAACELGSIRRAAESLRLSQPAVTRSIHELETELGVTLLERTPYGVAPTIFGQTLVARAKSVEREIQLAQNEIEQLRDVGRGEVRIGVTPVAAFHLLPLAISRLRRRHSKVRIEIAEVLYPQFLSSLRQRKFDFVIGPTAHSIPKDEFLTEILFEDDLAIVSRCEHPITRKNNLTIEELAKLDWIPPAAGTARDALMQAFRTLGFGTPRCVIQTDTYMLILSILHRTDMVSLAPRQLFHQLWSKAGVSILNAGFDFPPQPAGIIRHSNNIPSGAAKHVIAAIRQAALSLKKSTK